MNYTGVTCITFSRALLCACAQSGVDLKAEKAAPTKTSICNVMWFRLAPFWYVHKR